MLDGDDTLYTSRDYPQLGEVTISLWDNYPTKNGVAQVFLCEKHFKKTYYQQLKRKWWSYISRQKRTHLCAAEICVCDGSYRVQLRELTELQLIKLLKQ